MRRKSSWWPRAGALTGLLLLMASGCLKDFDSLSSEHGKGGASSKAGASGHGATSGAGAGASPADAGAAGVSGEGGEGDTGGTGGTSGRAGAGGKGGGGDIDGSGGQCAVGLTLCPPMTECTDLEVGDTDGELVTNCGKCANTCKVDHADSTTCTAGSCKPTCKTGFGDCNAATANDGCEADLTTPTSCGSCAKVCSRNGTASLECVSGACVLTCADRYADCNSSTVDPLHDDGCEVYLDKLDACTLTDGCNGAHVACDPLKVCNAGACVAPQGVAVLSTPLTAANQQHRFADTFPGNPKLPEGTLVTARVYAPGATGGTLVMYLSDTASGYSQPYLNTELKTLSDHWVDVTITVASGSSFDASRGVKQVNLELWGGTGPWLSPASVVYVDSVRSSDLTINDKFDASFAPMVTSTQQTVPGSTLTWLTAVP